MSCKFDALASGRLQIVYPGILVDTNLAPHRQSAREMTERKRYDGRKDKLVATGTWYYDGTVPMLNKIYAKLARFASSRYDDDDELDESRPIPGTKDCLLYYCWPGRGE